MHNKLHYKCVWHQEVPTDKKKDAMQEPDCKNNIVTHKCFFIWFEDVKKKVFIKSVFEAWTGHSQ